mmetsp:Transcript_82121/g.213973  ORF Transcript_82121/g.213973 Transcript_82121/m.213973 type:complete len:159 (-) Transcript_82121:164-640(-)
MAVVYGSCSLEAELARQVGPDNTGIEILEQPKEAWRERASAHVCQPTRSPMPQRMETGTTVTNESGDEGLLSSASEVCSDFDEGLYIAGDEIGSSFGQRLRRCPLRSCVANSGHVTSGEAVAEVLCDDDAAGRAHDATFEDLCRRIASIFDEVDSDEE